MKPALRWPAAACGLGLVLSISPAFADDPGTTLVITGTRTPQTETDALADIRVIDSSTIRAAGAQTLTELLQTFGGIEMAATGGAGQPSSVFMRGTDSSHVLLLVDGVRLGAADYGSSPFENIPLDQIDHIEVLRGPASSLYGAAAVGGVIQVFTRQGTRTNASIGTGTWNTNDASLGIGRQWGDTRFSLQAGYRESKSFPAAGPDAGAYTYNPAKVDDPFHNANLNLGLDQAWAPGQSLIARAFYSAANTHYDTGAGNDDVTRARTMTFSLESRNRISERWSSSLKVAGSGVHYSFIGSQAARSDTDRTQASWQNDLSALGGKVVLGLDWEREALDSDGALPVTPRKTNGVFAGYSTALGAHSIEASVRDDSDSQFGNHATGKIAYGWRFAPSWRWSVTAGNAFMAPDFSDLYYPGFSNPSLRPENSLDLETSLRYDHDGLQWGLTAFQNTIRQYIIYPNYVPQNVGSARISGATLDAAYSVGTWSARAEWSLQDPYNNSSQSVLLRRARYFGSASLNKAFGRWSGGLEWVASGVRYDYGDARLGGYGFVNLHAAYALSARWTIDARLNNVADKRYELAQGYNTPGRNLFVNLRASFD